MSENDSQQFWGVLETVEHPYDDDDSREHGEQGRRNVKPPNPEQGSRPLPVPGLLGATGDLLKRRLAGVSPLKR